MTEAKTRPWQRWTVNQLEYIAHKLDATPPDHRSTDDRLLAAELGINRFVPDGVIKTDDDYQKIRRKLCARIEEAIRNPTPQPKPWVSETDVTIPNETQERIENIYRRHGSLCAQSVGSCFDSYRRLVAAKENGYARAQGVSANDEWCQVAKELVKDREYSMDDLLTAFDHPNGDPIILPHPKCPHYQLDGGSWCRCGWRATKRPPPPGVDPDFERWLEVELKRT